MGIGLYEMARRKRAAAIARGDIPAPRPPETCTPLYDGDPYSPISYLFERLRAIKVETVEQLMSLPADSIRQRARNTTASPDMTDEDFLVLTDWLGQRGIDAPTDWPLHPLKLNARLESERVHCTSSSAPYDYRPQIEKLREARIRTVAELVSTPVDTLREHSRISGGGRLTDEDLFKLSDWLTLRGLAARVPSDWPRRDGTPLDATPTSGQEPADVPAGPPPPTVATTEQTTPEPTVDLVAPPASTGPSPSVDDAPRAAPARRGRTAPPVA
jgi:hypothetical protein